MTAPSACNRQYVRVHSVGDIEMKKAILSLQNGNRGFGENADKLLVVTADHQTGGLSILDGGPAIGRVTGRFTTSNHSGVAVPIYATGAGAARFHGIMENTQVPTIIRGLIEQSSRRSVKK